MCCLEPATLANWLPLRCPKLVFILLPSPLHTYHNVHLFFRDPLWSFGLFPRGVAGFFLHGPGVCHVRWVPPCPSNEGLFLAFGIRAFSVQPTPETTLQP